MLIFQVVFGGWAEVGNGSSPNQEQNLWGLSLNLENEPGGIWVNIWCGFRWQQDGAFSQMDFRAEAGMAQCVAKPLTPIREEQFGGFSIQNSQTRLRVCLEGGSPSQLPKEFLEIIFLGRARPNKVKKKNLPSRKHCGKNNSILKENSLSPSCSWLGDAFLARKN